MIAERKRIIHEPTGRKRMIQELAGWLPALILPTATLLQIVKIIRQGNSDGVSMSSWILFGIANLGTYVFTGRYTAIQTILGFLLTAILNFVIVLLIVYYNRKNSKQNALKTA